MTAKGIPAYLEFGGIALSFDVNTSENTSHSVQATDHPVETGPDITDNVRNQNDRVTLTVFVSNTPIRDVNAVYGGSYQAVPLNIPKLDKPIYPTPGSLENAAAGAIAGAVNDLLNGPSPPLAATVLTWPTKFDQVKDIVTQLLLWKEAAVVGSVVTPYRQYDSMIIEEVDVERTADTGAGAKVTLNFRAVRLVTAALTTAPIPTETRGNTFKNKGSQPPAEVSDTEAKVAIKKMSDAKAFLSRAIPNPFGSGGI